MRTVQNIYTSDWALECHGDRVRQMAWIDNVGPCGQKAKDDCALSHTTLGGPCVGAAHIHADGSTACAWMNRALPQEHQRETGPKPQFTRGWVRRSEGTKKLENVFTPEDSPSTPYLWVTYQRHNKETYSSLDATPRGLSAVDVTFLRCKNHSIGEGVGSDAKVVNLRGACRRPRHHL